MSFRVWINNWKFAKEHQFFDCQWIDKDWEIEWSHALSNTLPLFGCAVFFWFFFNIYVIVQTKGQEKGNLCLKMEYIMHFPDILRTFNKHQIDPSGDTLDKTTSNSIYSIHIFF